MSVIKKNFNENNDERAFIKEAVIIGLPVGVAGLFALGHYLLDVQSSYYNTVLVAIFVNQLISHLYLSPRKKSKKTEVLVNTTTNIEGKIDTQNKLESQSKKAIIKGLDRANIQVEINAGKIKELEKNQKNWIKELQLLNEKIINDASSIRQLRQSMTASNNKVMIKVGHDTVDNLVKGIAVEKAKFVVAGEHLAVQLYIQFWEILVSEQEANKKQNKDPLVALASHTNDVKLWLVSDNEFSQTILDLQRNFTNNGGVIVRILVNKNESHPSSEYQEALCKMKDYGITARYLKSETELYGYDIIIVKDLNIVARWYPSPNKRRLRKCELIEGINQADKSQWNRYYTESVSKDGGFEDIHSSKLKV